MEILVNPFDDMRKRDRIAQRTDKPATAVKKQKKRKGGKQLLSFGDEEEGGEDLPVLKKPKFDKRIVQDVEEKEEEQTGDKGRSE